MPTDRLITTIKPVAPFDFELTAGYHTYFQSRYGTDTTEDGNGVLVYEAAPGLIFRENCGRPKIAPSVTMMMVRTLRKTVNHPNGF